MSSIDVPVDLQSKAHHREKGHVQGIGSESTRMLSLKKLLIWSVKYTSVQEV